MSHDRGIMQRSTDGKEPIKGHHRQKVALCSTHGEEVELEQAANIGDALDMGDEIGQHFGHIRTNAADLQEREISQEDVHSVCGVFGLTTQRR